jgi:hypothetical protein
MSRAIMVAALALTAAICSGCSQAQTTTGAAHLAQARKACASIGLNTSEAPFVYCVMSLRQTAALKDAALQVEQGREACFKAGLKPGTPAFANCVLDHQPNAAAASSYITAPFD